MIGHMFNPEDDLLVKDRLRPRWSAEGAVAFLTFRTTDAISDQVIRGWERDKESWLAQRGHTGAHWSTLVPALPPHEQKLFLRVFNRCREDYLDSGQGQCWLNDPKVAGIVHDVLLESDGTSYRVGDFVIMPNHVHLLAAFPSQSEIRPQFESWCAVSNQRVRQCNEAVGELWHPEPFFHLLRSVEQYEWLSQFIADHPRKVGLKPGEFLFRSYRPQHPPAR
jgi:putative transposase